VRARLLVGVRCLTTKGVVLAKARTHYPNTKLGEGKYHESSQNYSLG